MAKAFPLTDPKQRNALSMAVCNVHCAGEALKVIELVTGDMPPTGKDDLLGGVSFILRLLIEQIMASGDEIAEITEATA